MTSNSNRNWQRKDSKNFDIDRKYRKNRDWEITCYYANSLANFFVFSVIPKERPLEILFFIWAPLLREKRGAHSREVLIKYFTSKMGGSVCSTARGKILASGNISLNLFIASFDTRRWASYCAIIEGFLLLVHNKLFPSFSCHFFYNAL